MKIGLSQNFLLSNHVNICSIQILFRSVREIVWMSGFFTIFFHLFNSICHSEHSEESLLTFIDSSLHCISFRMTLLSDKVDSKYCNAQPSKYIFFHAFNNLSISSNISYLPEEMNPHVFKNTNSTSSSYGSLM